MYLYAYTTFIICTLHTICTGVRISLYVVCTALHSRKVFASFYGWPEPYTYGVYTVVLAGNSPYIRSYTVYIYGSGQLYKFHSADNRAVQITGQTDR